jgi:hypothetical protein
MQITHVLSDIAPLRALPPKGRAVGPQPLLVYQVSVLETQNKIAPLEGSEMLLGELRCLDHHRLAAVRREPEGWIVPVQPSILQFERSWLSS